MMFVRGGKEKVRWGKRKEIERYVKECVYQLRLSAELGNPAPQAQPAP